MDDDLLPLAAQPHNGFFMEVFSDVERAKTFFLEQLTPEIVALVDWTTLALVPGTFIEANLLETRSDLLFSASLATTGESMLLYLLFEHQSTVDTTMPLRLLGYMLEIWRRQKDHTRLSPVLPFVLHQGPTRWTVSRQFQDAFDLPPSALPHLQAYLPKFEHGLLDLSQATPEQIVQDDGLLVVLKLMKMARQRRVVEFLTWFAAFFAESGMTPQDLIRRCLVYAFNVDPALDETKIHETLGSHPELKDIAMTLEQMLINRSEARGLAKGKAEGKAEGEARGTWIGKHQLLEEMMQTPVTPFAAFDGQSADEVKARFHELQGHYNRRYKQ